MPVISGNTENLSASVESLKEKKGEDLHFSKSLPFTDTSMKMELLSVNHHHNGQKFTDKPTEKCLFVRKMSFAYGQAIKNGCFVRKS